MPKFNNWRSWLGQSTTPGIRRVGEDLKSADSVFLVGLGRFGTAIALTLVDLGIEVLAVDTDPALVDEWADQLTHVRLADATNPATLTQLGVKDFDAAVVAIGTGVEASILTTAALSDMEKGPVIWAKAITAEHGRILDRVGADHVVFPEREMGERVAHAVSGQVLDYFELDEGFALAELVAPSSLVGQTLGSAGIRQHYGVTVVCIKPAGRHFTYATAETSIGKGDTLLVAGTVQDCERFAAAASQK